jgi:hypothetical protein
MFRIGVTGSYSVVAQYDSGAGGINRYDLDNILSHVSAKQNGASQVLQYEIKDAAQQPKQEAAVLVQRKGKPQAQVGQPDYPAALNAPRRDDTDGSLDRFAVLIDSEVSASITNLTKFVRECVNAHPAKHYMLVLSGHAGGAVGHFLLSEEFPKGNFSIRELAIALKSIRKFFGGRQSTEIKERLDILGLDACAMSMAEVGYELKDLTHFMVGAEGFEPNSGWPYQRILEELEKNSAITPAALASTIVEKYIDYYSDFTVAGRSTDQAACNLDNHQILFDCITQLAAILSGKLDEPAVMDAVILAHWRAQSYKFEEYVDLWDFCNLLVEADVDRGVTVACRNVRDAICSGPCEDESSSSYVLKSCYSGPMYQHSHGLSIYFPWVLNSQDLHEYQTRLFFSQDTLWGEFIEKYVNVTRRAERCAASTSADGGARVIARSFTAQLNRITSPADRITSPADRITPRADRITPRADRITPRADRFIPPVGRITSKADRMAALLDGGDLFIPKVKNPPVGFRKHPCVEENKEQNNGKK